VAEAYVHFALNLVLLLALLGACGETAGSSVSQEQSDGVRRYLTGLLWVLEMYHHGYCRDFNFIFDKRFHTYANAGLIVRCLAAEEDGAPPLAPPRSHEPPLRPITCAICLLPAENAERLLCPVVPELRPMFSNQHPLLGGINTMESNPAAASGRSSAAQLQQRLMEVRAAGQDDSAVKAELTRVCEQNRVLKQGGTDIDTVPLREIDEEVAERCAARQPRELNFEKDVTFVRQQGQANGRVPAKLLAPERVAGEWPMTEVQEEACGEEVELALDEVAEGGEEALEAGGEDVELAVDEGAEEWEEAVEAEAEDVEVPIEAEAEDELVEVPLEAEAGGEEGEEAVPAFEECEDEWPEDEEEPLAKRLRLEAGQEEGQPAEEEEEFPEDWPEADQPWQDPAEVQVEVQVQPRQQAIPRPALARVAASAGRAAGAAVGAPLDAATVQQVAAYLRTAGGSVAIGRLASVFTGVKKVQLAPHFDFVPQGGGEFLVSLRGVPATATLARSPAASARASAARGPPLGMRPAMQSHVAMAALRARSGQPLVAGARPPMVRPVGAAGRRPPLAMGRQA